MKRARLLIGISFFAFVLLILPNAFSHTPSFSPATVTNPSSPTLAQVSKLVQLVQQNPTFITAENGTTYTYLDYAGVGISYYNGTSSSGELLLYFDHYSATGTDCRSVIQSQLQVYITASGIILSVVPLNNQTELNLYTGPGTPTNQSATVTTIPIC
jgi:hypothetical protein